MKCALLLLSIVASMPPRATIGENCSKIVIIFKELYYLFKRNGLKTDTGGWNLGMEFGDGPLSAL